MRKLAVVGLLMLGFTSQVEAGRKGVGGGSRSSSTSSKTSGKASSKSSSATGTGASSSSHSVKGYTTKRGTKVAPHEQTNADDTQQNNYSTKGNVNPSTGKAGTKSATH
jgi:hypothetical protein